MNLIILIHLIIFRETKDLFGTTPPLSRQTPKKDPKISNFKKWLNTRPPQYIGVHRVSPQSFVA